MATITERLPSRTSDKKWLRHYPPLLSLVVAVLITVIILPSALNLPQANPSTLLEFAPVPPTDDSPPSNETGGFSSLGLGSSRGLTSAAPPNIIKQENKQTGKGLKPITKHCVGKPLRQTEDPNSPPCVPFFDGDNGGVTWQGVTENEIKILIYHAAFTSDNNETEGSDTSAGETTPSSTYCDLDLADDQQPDGWDCTDGNTGGGLSIVAAARALSHYFNDRFQTYGRRLHFYIYWTGASSTAGRKSDASDNWDTLKPLAVIDRATFGGYNDDYAEAMANYRTLSFGSFGFLTNSYYRELEPMAWNYWPDVEHWADLYITYVCNRIAPYPVAHSGNGDNGQPRRYAIMSTDDPSYPGLADFREQVKLGIEKCGIRDPLDIRFPFAGANVDNRAGANSTYGLDNVAKMKQANITTVLWLGGMESKTTFAADQGSYYPEWVVAGDRVIDDLLNGRAQAQNVWSHAWVVSQQLREIRFEESPARQAYREADPGGRQIHEYWATTLYKDMFNVSKAIQVAGPELSPSTVDQGQHAIPKYSSSDPRVAACFYDPDDFSCVKDSAEAWWDPNAQDPNREAGVQGCWRLVAEGRRYLAGGWPQSPDQAFANPNDTCNGIKGASYNYLA